jgi:hypothetical protein
MLVRLNETSKLFRMLDTAPLSDTRVAVGESGAVSVEIIDTGRERAVGCASSPKADPGNAVKELVFDAGSQTSDGSSIPTPLTSSERFKNCKSDPL